MPLSKQISVGDNKKMALQLNLLYKQYYYRRTEMLQKIVILSGPRKMWRCQQEGAGGMAPLDFHT